MSRHIVDSTVLNCDVIVVIMSLAHRHRLQHVNITQTHVHYANLTIYRCLYFISIVTNVRALTNIFSTWWTCILSLSYILPQKSATSLNLKSTNS